MTISDRVAIVTGASAGIGRATAARLSASGARVALAARSASRLEELSSQLRRAGGQALVVPTDMRVPEQVTRMVEETFSHFGRLDILVNDAGQSLAGTVEEVSVEDYLSIVQLNLFGPLLAMQAAIPKMRRGEGGVIVNVSSMTSRMHIPALGTYASTKAALNVLSETARFELERDNIRVITVLPRMTDTDFGRNALGSPEIRRRQRSTGASSAPVDSAEFVAGRILWAIEQEPPELTMEG